MAIHSPRMWWVAVALLVWAPHAHCREFTHEDIRQALLSLVHMMRTSDGKLERHELREKALGEQLKKMIVGVEKKALEPLITKIARLDDRLSNVETILLQKEQKETASQKKIDEALENIQKTLQTLTTPAPKVPVDMDNNLPAGDDALQRRLDATDAKIDAVKNEIKGLKSSLSKESLHAMCLDVASDINPFEKHITEAEKLLSKYEVRLGEYNSTATANKTPLDIEPYLDQVSQADQAWHNKMAEVMERQESEVVKIQRLLSDAEGMWKDLPRLADLHRATNHTLEAVSRSTQTTVENNDKSVDKLVASIRNMGDRLQKTNNDIQQSLTDSNTLIETLSKGFFDLAVDVKVLPNIKQMITDMHLDVGATKSRIDRLVYKIIQGLAGLVGEKIDGMDSTMSRRLNIMESTIKANQTIAIKKLASTVVTDMDQVWRQTGIMTEHIRLNKLALSNLNDYTRLFANSSTTTMNKVNKEVIGITTKMDKLTHDVNQGVGELSVTAQKFKLISKDLSEAFNKIKNSNSESEHRDAGPGPHVVDNTEKET